MVNRTLASMAMADNAQINMTKKAKDFLRNYQTLPYFVEHWLGNSVSLMRVFNGVMLVYKPRNSYTGMSSYNDIDTGMSSSGVAVSTCFIPFDGLDVDAEIENLDFILRGLNR